MKIVFISNFYNYHQAALTEALAKYTDNNFWFIETTPMNEQRKSMGWNSQKKPFVLSAYDSAERNKCAEIIYKADAVIVGSAPKWLIPKGFSKNQLLFKYSERLFKKRITDPSTLMNAVQSIIEWRKYKNAYLLAASAYAPGDYARIGLFRGKAFRWGYFPETIIYDDVDTLLEEKNSAELIWCGRFIDWKHPEVPIEIARLLKRDGYKFHLRMIGDGQLKQKIKEDIIRNKLENEVELTGNVTPDKVRQYMERAMIFMFTSDKQEGWGVVLNEAMNSCCAVVANQAIGSVPFLFENQSVGLSYHDGDINDLYIKVRTLIDDVEKARQLGRNAYTTLREKWNADVAAQRIVNVIEGLSEGRIMINEYRTGPCSQATICK